MWHPLTISGTRRGTYHSRVRSQAENRLADRQVIPLLNEQGCQHLEKGYAQLLAVELLRELGEEFSDILPERTSFSSRVAVMLARLISCTFKAPRKCGLILRLQMHSVNL
jgi:hypothetical protein